MYLFKTLWILQDRSIRHLGEFFQIFKRCSLDDFQKCKMSMGLYNRKEKRLHTTDRESVLKRTAIAYVVNWIQTGIRLNRGHYIKESHPFRKTLLLKLWIPQRYIGGFRKCLKVYIAEGAALVSSNKNKVRFSQNPVHRVHRLLLFVFFMNMSTA